MLQQLLDNSIASSAPACRWRIDEHRKGIYPGDVSTPVAISELLESINARRARGESFASIAAALNKQGVSGRYGGRWYAGSVWAYLQRRT